MTPNKWKQIDVRILGFFDEGRQRNTLSRHGDNDKFQVTIEVNEKPSISR